MFKLMTYGEDRVHPFLILAASGKVRPQKIEEYRY